MTDTATFIKGDSTAERPHRRAAIVEQGPDTIITAAQLAAVAGTAKKISATTAKTSATTGTRSESFDLAAWLAQHVPDADGPHDYDGGRKWILPVCPFNSEHDRGEAFVMERADGKPAFACHHNSCDGKKWQQFREHFEPGCYARRAARTDHPRADVVDGEALRTDDEAPAAAVPFDLSGGRRKLTDFGNSERIVDRRGKDLRFVYGLGWYWWTGRRWRRDTSGRARRWAAEVAREIWDEISRVSPEYREAYAKHAKSSESASKITGALSLAEDHPAVRIDAEDLDRDPWIITVRNCTLDLRTGEARPHRREDLITRETDVEFVPSATAPRWEAFLRRVLVDDELIEFMRRVMFYALTGSTAEHAVFFLLGKGKNGKSVFVNVLRALAGDYGTTAKAETFMLKKYPSDGPSPEIAALRGARVVTVMESSESARLDEGLVKSMSGEDEIAGRFCFEDQIKFFPSFKLFLATNYPPSVRGQDDGIWRRLHKIPFDVTIPESERDKALGAKLAAELPGILNWVLAARAAFLETGLDVPKRVATATSSYKEEQDEIGAFLTEQCDLSPKAEITSAALHSAYSEWAKNGGGRPLSKVDFGRRLAAREGIESGTVGRARGWIGVRLSVAVQRTATDKGPFSPTSLENPPRRDVGENGHGSVASVAADVTATWRAELDEDVSP